MKNWHLRESTAIPGLIHGVEDGFGRGIKLSGFALSASPEASQNTRDVLKAVMLHDDLVSALEEAERQIVYLHEKFQATGSGEAALAKIRSALARAEAN